MNAIKEKRLALGLSQKALAEAIGSAQSTVWAWESGLRTPLVENIFALSVVLQCSPKDLGFQLAAPGSRRTLNAEQASHNAPNPAQEYIEHRLNLGLTRDQLAERSGVSQSTIKRFETGKLQPHWDTRQKLRKALGMGEDRHFSVQERNAKFLELEKCIGITIRSNWRSVRATRMEYEDVYQELSLQMIRALDRYEGKNGAALKTFFKKTLEYKFKTYLFRHCMHGLSGDANKCPHLVFSSLDAMMEAGYQAEAEADSWDYEESRPQW